MIPKKWNFEFTNRQTENAAEKKKERPEPVKIESSDSSSSSSSSSPVIAKKEIPIQKPTTTPPVKTFATPAKLPTRTEPKKIVIGQKTPLPRKLPKKAARDSDSDSDEDDYDDDDDDVFVQPAKKDLKKGVEQAVVVPSVQPAPEPATAPAPAPAPAAAPEPIAEEDYVEAKLPIFMYLIPLDATSTAQCQKFQLDVPRVTINHEEGSVDVELQISKPTLKTDWVKQTLRQAAEKRYRFYDEESDANITLNQTAIMDMHPIITFVNHGPQKEWHDFFYELATDGYASNSPTTKWLHYQEMSIIDGRNSSWVLKFRVAIFINSTEGPFKR